MTTTVSRETAPPAAPPQSTPHPPPHQLQSSPFARLFGALEEMSWLEGAAEKLTGALAPVARRRGLMDVLNGRWLGHALHPAISDLPLGMWAAVPVLDLAGDEGGATALTAAGCVAAVATAATGAADWTATHGRERRLALLHGMVNAAALAIELGALGARLSGRRGAGRALSLAGLGVGSAAAFVGGELVFGRGIMVDHTAWMAGPADWTAVLSSRELPDGAMRAVPVEGRQVLLARIDGVARAMEDACTHAGGPLHEGTVEGESVVCPWHSSRFSLRDGCVLGGPATFPQLRLEVREAGGRIEVRGREG